MGEPLYFNFGAGHRHIDGFVNCDLDNNWSKKKPDAVIDHTQPLPIESDSADEVHSYHVLEHVYRWQADTVLEEWMRILKPGGKLVIEMPCLDKVMAIFFQAWARSEPVPMNLTMWPLYGDPGYKVEAMVHRWCWSVSEITALLTRIGFREVQIKEPKTHKPIRDFRVEAIK